MSPRKLPSGTLRALLEAIGRKLEKAGRIKARGTNRDAYAYSARREALPEGVKAEALAAAWLAELRQPLAARRGGAKNALTEIPCRGEKAPRRGLAQHRRTDHPGRWPLWWRFPGDPPPAAPAAPSIRCPGRGLGPCQSLCTCFGSN